MRLSGWLGRGGLVVLDEIMWETETQNATKAGRYAVLVRPIGDRRLDRAAVAEHHGPEHVVGRDGEHVFGRGKHLEVAADDDLLSRAGTEFLGRRPAELEAADGRHAAGVKPIVDRRVVAFDADDPAGCRVHE